MNTKEKAATLVEALPYLQRFRGKTLLIKIGGSAMDNPELVSSLMRDIVFLEVAGINPVLVHGGGKAISSAMEAAGLEARFVGGLRVTSPEAIATVESTLGNTINPELVNLINQHGGIPRFYIRLLCDLEVYIKTCLADKASFKKLIWAAKDNQDNDHWVQCDGGCHREQPVVVRAARRDVFEPFVRELEAALAESDAGCCRSVKRSSLPSGQPRSASWSCRPRA